MIYIPENQKLVANFQFSFNHCIPSKLLRERLMVGIGNCWTLGNKHRLGLNLTHLLTWLKMSTPTQLERQWGRFDSAIKRLDSNWVRRLLCNLLGWVQLVGWVTTIDSTFSFIKSYIYMYPNIIQKTKEIGSNPNYNFLNSLCINSMDYSLGARTQPTLTGLR